MISRTESETRGSIAQMSNGCAGETKRARFLLRLRGFVTGVARNYYCNAWTTRKSGKQFARDITPLVLVNLLLRLASHRRTGARAVAEAGFFAEITDSTVSGQFLGRPKQIVARVLATLPCPLVTNAARRSLWPAPGGASIATNLPGDLPNLQAVHLEFQRAERNTQRPSGRRNVPPPLFEGPNDEVALERRHRPFEQVFGRRSLVVELRDMELASEGPRQ